MTLASPELKRPAILETKRLYLKLVDPPCYNNLLSSGTDQEIMQQFGIGPEDLHLEKERYKAGLETYNLSFIRFYLVDKADGNTIGCCSYHAWYVRHHRAELGYIMTSEAHKQQGLMKEALGTAIIYGFESMQLHRIEAMIGPANTPSLKLVKAFGFREEGLLRQHYLKDGIYHDSLVFSLLKDEFAPKKL